MFCQRILWSGFDPDRQPSVYKDEEAKTHHYYVVNELDIVVSE